MATAHSYPRFSARAPLSRGGHTLIELVVALSILMLLMAVSLATFGRVLEGTESRSASQSVQGGLAEVQVETLQLGGRQALSVAEGSWTHLRFSNASRLPDTVCSDSLPDVAVATNVERWAEGSSVTVAFAGWFAAPDSAGSIYLGEAVGGNRVVVRAATGLTRRERR